MIAGRAKLVLEATLVHDPSEAKLFPTLPEASLHQLQEYGSLVTYEDGAEILTEGTPNYPFYAVLEGKVRMMKQVAGEAQQVAVHGPGQFVGEVSMLTGGAAAASAHAVGQVKVIRVDHENFRKVAAACDTLGATIMTALTGRSLELSAFTMQQEKLAALGKLSAGLAHELNNPAAAARRASENLKEAMAKVQRFSIQYDCRFSGEQRDALIQWQGELMTARCDRPELDAMDRSDKEEAVAAWLEQQGIGQSWELSPALVAAGVEVPALERLGSSLNGPAVNGAIEWLHATLEMDNLSSEMESAMTRISELVGAMKEYSYMDQSSFQEIDIHKGLESTLRIFGSKLRGGVEVVREYDRTVPHINAYVGELNQVWTNLIANAIEAMNGKGRLTVRTAHEEDRVLVEIADSGPGIPDEVKPHIFEPFFTTKPVGEGTGLGLDITHRIITGRHHGTIRVQSEPGNTRFQVRLPLQQPKEAK